MAYKHPKPVKSGKAENHVQKTNGSNAKQAPSSESTSDPDMFEGVHRSILETFDNLFLNDDMSFEQSEDLARYWIPPDSKSESFAIKLIDNGMASFSTKEIKLQPWLEDKGRNYFYLPGLKPNHFTIFPKCSVLTCKEQVQLYNFYCNMTFRSRRPLNEQQLARFQELRTKVAEEYAEFQEFAMSEWYKGQWERVLMIPPQVEQFIDSLWKMRAGQCLTSYPDDYRCVRQIPLTLHDPNEDYSVFEFSKHVKTQSLPVKLSLPKTKEQVVLISEFQDLSRMKPVSSDLYTRSKPLMKLIPTASFDNNIEYILKKNDLDIDVVITMSGIKTLIDNIKFQREWVLPVTVKEVLKDDGETRKKVVIIDKNLPPKCLSVHEKNIWHAKIVAKWMLILSEFPDLLEKQNETSPKKGDESFKDMLSEVVQQLELEKATGKVEMESESSNKSQQPLVCSGQQRISKPSEGCPVPGSSLANNFEIRSKGDRVLTSCGHVPNNIRSPVDADVKTKPLLRSSESIVNKQEIKKEPATCDNGASLRNPKEIYFQENNVIERKRERQCLSYDDPFTGGDVQDIDEFGVDPIPSKNVQTKEIRPKKSVCSSICEEGNLAKKIKSPEKEVSPGSMRKNIQNETDGNLTRTFVRSFIKPVVAQKAMLKPCLQYQIWNLHKSKYIQFLKSEQRSLNVLVRTRRDGKLFHYENNIKMLDDVCVSSKLEFQPEYGASKMAASELTREYLDLYMRPNSKLVRVRSIGHTKEVMMTEVKTMAEVKTALQIEVQKNQKLFDPLYAVLTKLIDLAPGRYMLQHKARDGPFATLLVEAPGQTSFNLAHYCQEFTRVEVNVPPMPIDPLVLSPLQHRDRLAPALFTPRSEHVPAYFRKPQGPLGGKKRKRKHKKKKKEPPPSSNDESFDLVSDSLGIDSLWPS